MTHAMAACPWHAAMFMCPHGSYGGDYACFSAVADRLCLPGRQTTNDQPQTDDDVDDVRDAILALHAEGISKQAAICRLWGTSRRKYTEHATIYSRVLAEAGIEERSTRSTHAQRREAARLLATGMGTDRAAVQAGISPETARRMARRMRAQEQRPQI